MRFLIHEMGFERPLSAGELRYEQDGKPTGAVEKWRLTQAVAGYRFLRIDLDERENNGNSTLYHLTLTDGHEIERINFRFWNEKVKINGNLILENAGISLARTVNNERTESVTNKRLPLFFSAGMGLSFAGRLDGEMPAFYLNEQFELIETELYVGLCKDGDGECRQLRWNNHQRTIWLNPSGWVIKMQRPDGLTAQATRFIQYQKLGAKNEMARSSTTLS